MSRPTGNPIPPGRSASEFSRQLRHTSSLRRTFPTRGFTPPTDAPPVMTPLRWVAGAAAAGLFIGFAAEVHLSPERLHRARPHGVVRRGG